MARKVTITLDEQILAFVDRQAEALHGGKSNRSGFINAVLGDEKRRCLERELIQAYQQDSQDPIWRKEATVWDATVSDGIDA